MPTTPNSWIDRLTVKNLLELSTVGGLPLGAALSAVIAVLARVWLAPLYAAYRIPVSAFAELTLSWLWLVGWVLYPVLMTLLCTLLLKRTGARVVVSLVAFQVWLVGYLLTVWGIVQPLLALRDAS